MITDDELARIRPLVTSGPVLGVELDLRYRVLALTVEPVEGREQWADDAASDRRLQLLLHPVGDVAASLHDVSGDGVRILVFEPDQLPDIVSVVGETVTSGEPFPDAAPDRSDWGPQPSMEGTSKAPDGRARHLSLDLTSADHRLRLVATFDDVEVRDPDGAQLWASDAARHVPGGPAATGRNLPLL